MSNLIITCPSFEDSGWIPDRFSGYGEDISPEIDIDGIPPSAVSLVITLDDMDHPIQRGYNHWVAWNLQPLAVIPQGIPRGSVIHEPIYAEQGVAYGKHCYRGPKPPFNWNHRYCFTVYALDSTLALNTDCGKTEVLEAIKGHVLSKGELQGKYQRKHG